MSIIKRIINFFFPKKHKPGFNQDIFVDWTNDKIYSTSKVFFHTRYALNKIPFVTFRITKVI